MALSCRPSWPSSPVFPACPFVATQGGLVHAHDRTEFIKIWYEFARVPVVFRSVLPESYERPRPPDVSGITFRAIFFWSGSGQRAACPGGFAPLHQRQLSLNRRIVCPNQEGQGGFMARQFIYHMQGLSKTYPGNRKILE